MKSPTIPASKKKIHHHRPAPKEELIGAFKLDDDAQTFAKEFIAEATSAEHEAEEGREDAVAEESRERFMREMRELDGVNLEEEEA